MSSLFYPSSQLITLEHLVHSWLFSASIVQLFTTEWRKKAGVSRESADSIGLIYCTTISVSGAPYHRSYRCSAPYHLGIHYLSHLQCKDCLICVCLESVCQFPFLPDTQSLDEISQVHAPAPQGNSRRYGYYANYSDRAKSGQYKGRAEGATDTDGCFRAKPNNTACSPPFFSGNSLHPRPVPLQIKI